MTKQTKTTGRRLVRKGETALLLLVLLASAVSFVLARSEPGDGSRKARVKRPAYTDPKATYVAYLEAIKANHLTAAKDCWYISDGNESGALDVVVGLWTTFHRFDQMVRARFKAEGLRTLRKWNSNILRDDCSDAALARTLERIKDAKVEREEDTAALHVKWRENDAVKDPVFNFSGDNPIATFRRVKGMWKLDFHAWTGLKRPADFFEPGTWGPMFRDQKLLLDGIISDIERNRLKTANQTVEALEQRYKALRIRYEREAKERETGRRGK